MAIAIPEAFGDAGSLFAAPTWRSRSAATSSSPREPRAGDASRAHVHVASSPGRCERRLAGSPAASPTSPRAWLWVDRRSRSTSPARRRATGCPGLRRVARPTTGRSTPAHFAERFQLSSSSRSASRSWSSGRRRRSSDSTPPRSTAIAVAFLGTAALWWLYFDYVAEIAQPAPRATRRPGRLARDAYTYLHLPIVAGIIVTAVGDEIVIAHPGGALRRPSSSRWPPDPALPARPSALPPADGRIAERKAAGGMVAIGAAGCSASPAGAGGGRADRAVLVALIAAETVAGRRRRAVRAAAAHP